MKPIIKFYTEFLNDLGLRIADDGLVTDPAGNPVLVSIKRGAEKKIQKLPLCLPTQQALEKDSGTVVYFHPACEGLDAGQSEVFNATLKLVNAMTYASIVATVNALMHAAADTERHSSLKQPVMELVSQLPDVSQGTLASWISLSKKLTVSGDMALLNYHMERDQSIEGIKYGRVARFRTKVLESENLYTPKGMSQIAERAIRKAIQLVVGEPVVDVGSNAQTAPYFTALAKCYHQVMQRVSRVASILGVIEVGYQGNWSANIDNLHDWYRGDATRAGTGLYIQLDGNIGESVVRRQASQAAHVAQPVAPPARPDNTMQIPPPAPPVVPPPIQHQMYQQPMMPQVIPQEPQRTPGVMSIPTAMRSGLGQYQPSYGQPNNPGMWFDDRTGQWRPRSVTAVPPQPTPWYGQPQPQVGGYQQAAPQGYPQQPTLVGYDINGNPVYR